MSLGSFRFLWQPFRPFIAGTKFTNYVMMKHSDEQDEERKRSPKAKMIHVDPSLSPPPTPVDLSAPVNLVASSPTLATCTVTSASRPNTPTSPDVIYDGVTFTANVAGLFSVAPTSPPASDYDDAEVSLFDDETLEKMDVGSVSSRSSSLGSSDGFINSELAEAAIQAVQSAPALATAVTSVLQTGSITPLIKEELKYTIQTKRMRDGKAELSVTKAKKKKSMLTPEEEERRRRRRDRNKVAAQKCRDKKTEQAKMLEEEIEFLETRNDSLRNEMKGLNGEIEQLRNMLIRHDKSTQCSHSFLTAINNDEEVVKPPLKRQKVKRCAQKAS